MRRPIALLACLALLVGPPSGAQEPRGGDLAGRAARHDAYRAKAPGAVKSGVLSVEWKEGGKAFEFRRGGKRFRYDLAARAASEAPAEGQKKEPGARATVAQRGRPGRGRQFASETSPDGLLRAFHRDRNLWLSDARGVVEARITPDGDAAARIKYGVASWVYGEELEQDTAIWWSPDSSKVAFYRFDESKVADYYLQVGQLALQSEVEAEPYPKAGTANPIADLVIYDVQAKTQVRVDVRDGRPFEDDSIGHYVYAVAWSPDGSELLFNRTDRLQKRMELAAADPATGKVRPVIREEWPASWVENLPVRRFLDDGRRFIWSSERNGYKNYYLYNLAGEQLSILTNHEFEVGPIVRVDEAAGVLDYMARSGDNPMKMQLHRVRLDGEGDRRLTDPRLHHVVNVAPDGRHFIDVAETHDEPPTTRLLAEDGTALDTLAESDVSEFNSMNLKRVELLKFKSADGETELYGLLHRPSDFDPGRKYPLLVSVYAGPATNGARETFVTPDPLAEYGVLVATFDSRSAAGRGKRFLDAIYGKLGTVEVDDQAAGVESLLDRSYVDRDAVGIQGTSYGGYASALALLRHPKLFKAGCAMSAVTDFRNYDTIYTERYLGKPQDNPEGYDGGSAVKLAGQLQGRLLIYFGTADDNVHPSNAYQLIQALDDAGKPYGLRVGPDRGHTALPAGAMMEFFHGALIAPGR